MKTPVSGLHHITAISSDVQNNMHFYSTVLGLRFVKKSVNQDDVATYHLYYGDYAGSPGTILTFFPWAGMRRGRPGTGQSYATAFSVPPASLPFWQQRFAQFKVEFLTPEKRFGEDVLTFFDPDGLRLELTATHENDLRPPAPSDGIPAENGIRGFHGTTLGLIEPAATASVLVDTMGYRLAGQSGHRARYSVGESGPGTYVDLLTDPTLPRGLNGAGTIHHVAFRVPDDAAQTAARATIVRDGLSVSPVIDRAYFKSIYYREPGGVLFEIATDQPGFAIDEPIETLGTKLSLPPHLESQRAEIEAGLPKIN